MVSETSSYTRLLGLTPRGSMAYSLYYYSRHNQPINTLTSSRWYKRRSRSLILSISLLRHLPINRSPRLILLLDDMYADSSHSQKVLIQGESQHLMISVPRTTCYNATKSQPTASSRTYTLFPSSMPPYPYRHLCPYPDPYLSPS